MYIHGIYIVFSACILHPVAGVAEEGRVPFPQIHIPLSKYVPMRRATKATAKRIGCWNREWNVIPGIYQVYAGIYLVYTKRLDRGQAAGPGRNPGPLAFYSVPALCVGLSLTSTRVSAMFWRDIHVINYNVLNPLNLFNWSRVEHRKGQWEPS